MKNIILILEEMEQILNSMFPKAEVTMCSSEGKRGDFNVVEEEDYILYRKKTDALNTNVKGKGN